MNTIAFRWSFSLFEFFILEHVEMGWESHIWKTNGSHTSYKINKLFWERIPRWFWEIEDYTIKYDISTITREHVENSMWEDGSSLGSPILNWIPVMFSKIFMSFDTIYVSSLRFFNMRFSTFLPLITYLNHHHTFVLTNSLMD